MIPETERLVILQLFDVLLARSRGEAMRGKAHQQGVQNKEQNTVMES